MNKSNLLAFLSLFTSLGTILCCALPALLVTLGMGATMAGLVSTAPWITALSDHKVLIFTIVGIIMSVSIWMQWRARFMPCPTDPDKARMCGRLRKISWIMIFISVALYLIGFFFAFLAKFFI